MNDIFKEKIEEKWLKEYGINFTSYFFDKYFDNKTKIYLNDLDNLAASISYDNYDYVINGKILKCSYILKPLFYHQYDDEIKKEILKKFLDEIKEEELITFIGNDYLKLYEELGFEKIYNKKSYILNKNNIKTLKNYHCQSDGEILDMLKCYGHFTSFFNGYKLRNDKDFKDLRDYKIKLGGEYIYYYSEGELKAYASYYKKDDDVYIDEIIYLDSLSFISIISYLLDRFKNVIVTLSYHENLNFLNHNLKYQEHPFILVRINDYEKFNELFDTKINNVIQGYMLSRKHPYCNEIY